MNPIEQKTYFPSNSSLMEYIPDGNKSDLLKANSIMPKKKSLESQIAASNENHF